MHAEQLRQQLDQSFLGSLPELKSSLQPGLIACSSGSPAHEGPHQIGWSVLAPAQPALPPWKRALDLTCILLTAPVWVPLAGLIALLVKAVSRGPVLYRQQRIGYLGRQFQCLKFRTMKVDADPTLHQQHMRGLMHSSGPMTKLDQHGDPRLIPGGWLLRALGLDELPQLWNVLKGQMSLVGPRPCTPYELEHYQPWQLQRFVVLPGLTGLWQVNGKNRTTFEEMVRLDIHYVQHKSLGMDLMILAKTVPVLLKQLHDGLRLRRRRGPRHSRRR